jgi:hypothetical protein
VGTPFPADVFDTSYTELALRQDVTGDKAGCGRTDVVREFRFPVVPGETLILEFLVYNRMAVRYRIRCVNKVLKVVEYQPSGLSAMRSADYVRNPRTSKLFFLEHLSIRPVPTRVLLRAYANHTRYSLHAGLVRQGLRDSPSKVLWGATLPFALGAYARDRRRLKRGSP